MSYIRVQHPSLELNWLPNSLLKNIPTPRMIYHETARYGGCFMRQQETDIEVFGMSLREGPVIVISNHNAGVIAHEWRHLWQCMNGLLLEKGSTVYDWSNNKTYKGNIIKYFTTQPHEMDALQFELLHGPTDLTLRWKEWIVKHYGH